MTALTVGRRSEQWPVWAKVLLVMMSLLLLVTLIPWLFMTYAMAAMCAPMMGTMDMMREGMGR